VELHKGNHLPRDVPMPTSAFTAGASSASTPPRLPLWVSVAQPLPWCWAFDALRPAQLALDDHQLALARGQQVEAFTRSPHPSENPQTFFNLAHVWNAPSGRTRQQPLPCCTPARAGPVLLDFVD